MVTAARRVLPLSIRRRIGVLRSLDWNPLRWVRLLSMRPLRRGEVRVFYGFDRLPLPGEPVHGGIVKFQRMQSLFPNSPRHFNLIYLGSSSLPVDWPFLLWLARQKRISLVLNQNGVAYPGWHGPGWEETNRPLGRVLHAADHVFYQSRFCKLACDRFLGTRRGPSEVLYNAVDTNAFMPATSDPAPRETVLLLAGDQLDHYRPETAFRTVSILARRIKGIRLLVTGRLGRRGDARAAQRLHQMTHELGIGEMVTFLGSYSQAAAPSVYHQAHLLLHTQYNDACPSTVLEAMACGLPVVYSASGGVPELVGPDAGIGVPASLSWDRIFPPDPERLAEAVMRVAEKRREYSEAARQRAVERFDLKPWLRRHREIFEALVG